MDLEEIIRHEVNKAVKEAVSSITIKTETMPFDKWINGVEAMQVLGTKSRTTLCKWTLKANIKTNQFGFYKYSDLMKIK